MTKLEFCVLPILAILCALAVVLCGIFDFNPFARGWSLVLELAKAIGGR